MPYHFRVNDKIVDLESLPIRDATELERRQMLGSLATVYELKNPLVYCKGTGKFHPIDYQDYIAEFDSGRELVILKTNVILPSIFRKIKKRRVNKQWNLPKQVN